MKTKDIKRGQKSFDFKITNVLAADTKDAQGSDDCIIEGYANTVDKDRVGDVVIPSAFEKTLPTYLKNPVLLFNHDWDDVCGRVMKAEITDKGLFVRAFVSSSRPDVKALVREGCVSTFSIGYNELDADYDEATKTKFIKELELLEISIVTIPANTEAMFTQVGTQKTEETPKKEEPKQEAAPQKSLEEFITEVKEVFGDIDEKLLTGISEYYENSKGDIMTKEQLIEALRAKSAQPAEVGAEDKKEDMASEAESEHSEDSVAMIVSRLDAMAEALAQLLEMAKKPEAEAPKPAEPSSEEAPKEEAPAKTETPAEAEKAVEEVKCEKCADGKMVPQEDGSMKCEDCGHSVKAGQEPESKEDQEPSLEELEALLADLNALES